MTQRNDDFRWRFSAHEAGAVALHRHRRGYAALILSGRYRERAPEGVWDCRDGDIVLHPAFHLHSNEVQAGDARVLNIALPDSTALPLDYGVISVHDPARLIRAPDCRDALAEALAGTPRAPARSMDWRDDFARALSANPHQCVADLARGVGLSAAHASRAFRALYTLSPAAFRSEHRLRAALRQLAQCSPLAEIAQTTGFADQAHMTRAFTAAFGISPARLRGQLI